MLYLHNKNTASQKQSMNIANIYINIIGDSL